MLLRSSLAALPSEHRRSLNLHSDLAPRFLVWKKILDFQILREVIQCEENHYTELGTGYIYKDGSNFKLLQGGYVCYY